VVLRVEAVRERLLKLEEIISTLDAIGRSTTAGDPRDAGARERGLQLAAEVVLDIGNHILSAHFGVAAQDYEDIIAQLGARGVIAEQLRVRLKGLGGLRNILVHGYLRLDPARVEAYLERAPADFTDFARAVRAWLDRVTSGER
jgi:uncharacterized protein YutE (UPF0331/DUF86 family)